MVDPSTYATEDSNDQNTSDDSDTISTVHLYMVEDGNPNGRGAGRNHHPEAFKALSDGSDLYRAFTKKGSGRRNDWSVSDTLSHIAMAYEPLAEVMPASPEAYVHLTNDVMGATVDALQGDNSSFMDWLEPDEEDIADYVADSDDVDAEAVIAALEERDD